MAQVKGQKRQKYPLWWSWTCEQCGTVKTRKYFDKSRIYRFCSKKCSDLTLVGEKNHAYRGGKMKVQGYWVTATPGHPRAYKDDYVLDHILIAEKALGHYLPEGTAVHHINEIKTDNRNDNLVICQNERYHQLLHTRIRRKKKFGDPNLKQCERCRMIADFRLGFPEDPATADGTGSICHSCFKPKEPRTYPTTCSHGHLLDEKTLRIRTGGRYGCRKCMNKRSIEWKRNKKLQNAEKV